jgi:hypothetical protein
MDTRQFSMLSTHKASLRFVIFNSLLFLSLLNLFACGQPATSTIFQPPAQIPSNQAIVTPVTISTLAPTISITATSQAVETQTTESGTVGVLPMGQHISSPEQLPNNIKWDSFGSRDPNCNGMSDHPAIQFASPDISYNRPHSFLANQIPQGARLFIYGCGFRPLGIVGGAFHLPNGLTDLRVINVGDDGEWLVEWWSQPSDPLGIYTFE